LTIFWVPCPFPFGAGPSTEASDWCNYYPTSTFPSLQFSKHLVFLTKQAYLQFPSLQTDEHDEKSCSHPSWHDY